MSLVLVLMNPSFATTPFSANIPPCNTLTGAKQTQTCSTSISLVDPEPLQTFPPDLLQLVGLATTPKIFEVTGRVGGLTVDLAATQINGGSVAAFGTVDFDSDGYPEKVGIYLNNTSTGTWTVTGYVYADFFGSLLRYGTISAQLVNTRWGSASAPLTGWELRNVSAVNTYNAATSYTTSNLPVSIDLLIGNEYYYYNQVTQARGFNSVTDYLLVGGSTWTDAYTTGSVSALTESCTIRSSGSTTYNSSVVSSSVQYSNSESWQTTPLLQTRATTTTASGTTIVSTSTNLFVASSPVVATTTTSSSTAALSFVAPTTWTGTFLAMVAPF